MSEDYIEYYSNNSGGRDWLTLWEWDNLRKAGWELRGFDSPIGPDDDLDDLGVNTPHYAAIRGLSMTEAIAAFELLTHQNVDDQGCSCCGPPHEFRQFKDGDRVWT